LFGEGGHLLVGGMGLGGKAKKKKPPTQIFFFSMILMGLKFSGN